MRQQILVLTLHVPGRNLARCARSVARQTGGGDVLHRVVVDGEPAPEVDRALRALSSTLGFQLSYAGTRYIDRPPLERVARLRADALANADAEWIAWLDDDNWWDADHLETLMGIVADERVLPHSWRRLWASDLQPYRDRANPWRAEDAGGMSHADVLFRNGVRSSELHLMRDAVFREPVDGFAGSIDLGEWLFPGELAHELGMPLPTGVDGPFEDDLLLWEILSRGIRPCASCRYSLNYVLGGTSQETGA